MCLVFPFLLLHFTCNHQIQIKQETSPAHTFGVKHSPYLGKLKGMWRKKANNTSRGVPTWEDDSDFNQRQSFLYTSLRSSCRLLLYRACISNSTSWHNLSPPSTWILLIFFKNPFETFHFLALTVFPAHRRGSPCQKIRKAHSNTQLCETLMTLVQALDVQYLLLVDSSWCSRVFLSSPFDF